MKLTHSLTAIALAICLQGCSVDVPSIASASYIVYAAGVPGPEVNLSSAQIQALSEWLDGHRAGWTDIMVTTPSPRTLIALQHANRPASTLDLWPHRLLAYGRFGQYERPLSDEEAAYLRRLLQPG